MVCKTAPTSPTHRRVSEAGGAQATTDYEIALDSVGYGGFSRSVLGACAMSFFMTGVQNCLPSYALPAARCELRLSTYQAGLINMAFMCGGVASAFFWGIAGDVIGRRSALAATLLLDAALTLAQSFVGDYRWLLLARCLNGFLIGGPSTLTFTYLSDLVGEKRRELYLTITGMSFVGAWLILPAVAWVIIPIKISYDTVLPIYSWRLLLAVCSIPGFVAGAWTCTLPESPRLLADTARDGEALQILANIHRRNKVKKEFKVKKLMQDSNCVAKIFDEDHSRTKELFVGVLKDLKLFVSKTYAVKSTLILFVFFANMAAGFGLNMWIPALLLRARAPACAAHAARANSTGADRAAPPHAPCDDEIGADVFTSGLIVGACCVAGSAACALLCRGGARGVRAAAAACAGACAAAAGALAAATCAPPAPPAPGLPPLPAAAALTAASLNGNVLLIRLLLHALPPKLSGLGVCWGAWWGRAGGVASNLAVGALLDLSCPAPFAAVAALLAVSVAAIMLIKLEEPKEESAELDGAGKDGGFDRYIATHM